MSKIINLHKKLSLFSELWTPKIVEEFNDNYIKIAKVKGDFVWHDHANEDELFLILKGQLRLEFRDKTIQLREGECYVVPKGIEHKPYAEEECHIMLIEPKSTEHTGKVKAALTKDKLDWI